MNRNFRSQDSPQVQMHATVVKQKQQLRASIVGDFNESIRSAKEKEEEQLALFMEMNKSEKDQSDLLNNNPNYFDSPPDSKPDNVPMFNVVRSSVGPIRKTCVDDFLNTDNDKSDYDWLLTPPGTPLFPSLDIDSQRTMMTQLSSPKARLSGMKSLTANSQVESITERSSNHLSKLTLQSPSSSSAGLRRPSSSGGPGSRPSTPTSRHSLQSGNKPARSSTPTSRPSLSTKSSASTARSSIATAKPGVASSRVLSSAAKPAVTSSKVSASVVKPSQTLSRTASSPATKPAAPTRSSTPTRPSPRSSTPTSRPSIPPSKPMLRSSTPTKRPPSSSATPGSSVTSLKLSSSVSTPDSSTKSGTVASRGVSPSPKARSWKPSEMPGYTHDAPPNLRTSAPDRPVSGVRGRPGAPTSRSSSIEPTATNRIRRQSCSPSRGRAPMQTSGGSVPALNRLHAKANDNVSPVVIGTKMVERVINMRKLAPPRPDDKHSPRGNLPGKSSSLDSTGFGRTISKKSLDMAIRHMDIRRALPGNLRPLMAKIPASSMYSVRTGPARNRTASITDSPVATSSNASSEMSNTGLYLDTVEFGDEFDSERSGRSPMRGR